MPEGTSDVVGGREATRDVVLVSRETTTGAVRRRYRQFLGLIDVVLGGSVSLGGAMVVLGTAVV